LFALDVKMEPYMPKKGRKKFVKLKLSEKHRARARRLVFSANSRSRARIALSAASQPERPAFQPDEETVVNQKALELLTSDS